MYSGLWLDSLVSTAELITQYLLYIHKASGQRSTSVIHSSSLSMIDIYTSITLCNVEK